MMLSDVKIRSAKPGEKPVKLFDGGGMFLLVTPAGGKCWRLKYRFGGKEKTLALGTYPEISLADARQRKDEARKHLANGVDPSEVKKARKFEEKMSQANTFKKAALQWHEKNRHTWVPSYADQIMRRLEADIFPVIGDRPISELKPMHLLAALQGIEKRGALESAHRIKQTCGQIMRYAVATGAAERDITADLRGALPPVKGKHHAALTDPRDVGPFLRAIDGFEGSFVVRCALRLAPLVFVRPGELRKAEWSE
ncbi:MAG: integrase arm-type DNA-binding domain-containing protein, partial [Deltaproteobacteria bacterium]|nr:integrase arm-type DNA-binding domain-containing protein [Deltaproteobacteria bacterium]